MRRALPDQTPPDHPGLAYEVWAPFDVRTGKISDSDRQKWLGEIANLFTFEPFRDLYQKAFDRWKKSFSQPGDVTVEVIAESRLLVGHGLGSATDVGLSLHRTWGVPVIPGSALKGLLAHWVDAVLGPERGNTEPERLAFAGVEWNKGRIQYGPGQYYRALFGAPDADEETADRQDTACQGLVTFHDALWVPDTPSGSPLAIDVLTVHQKRYYDSPESSPPVDWDDPNPVSFLSVCPKARFLLALSGPPAWSALAKDLLIEALSDWGVGGKTASGYGRLVAAGSGGPAPPSNHSRPTAGLAPPPKPGEKVECVLLEEKTKKGGWKARHEPSGIAGPIQNSEAVPETAKPGDRLILEVRIAKGSESGFRFVGS